MLNRSNNDIHVFRLCETKLKHFYADNLFQTVNCQFFQKDRILLEERIEEAGHIIVYVTGELKVERWCDLEKEESDCLLLVVKQANSHTI